MFGNKTFQCVVETSCAFSDNYKSNIRIHFFNCNLFALLLHEAPNSIHASQCFIQLCQSLLIMIKCTSGLGVEGRNHNDACSYIATPHVVRFTLRHKPCKFPEFLPSYFKLLEFSQTFPELMNSVRFPRSPGP